MNYEEATRKLYEIALEAIREVDETRKVFVGQTENGKTVALFSASIYDNYPAIHKEIRVLHKMVASFRREQVIAPEKSKETFWDIFHLLVNELLTTRYIMELPKHGFSKEIDRIFEILVNLDDQGAVIVKIASQVKQTWRSRTEVEKVTELVAERGLRLLQEKALTTIKIS